MFHAGRDKNRFAFAQGALLGSHFRDHGAPNHEQHLLAFLMRFRLIAAGLSRGEDHTGCLRISAGLQHFKPSLRLLEAPYIHAAILHHDGKSCSSLALRSARPAGVLGGRVDQALRCWPLGADPFDISRLCSIFPGFTQHGAT